jgi:molybdopterin converting factor small subunit
LFASISAPFITYATSKLTAKWFAKIRREDGFADLEVEKEYQELRTVIAEKTKNSNKLEQTNLIMQKENELLESNNKSLKEYRVELFYEIKAFVDCYD